jgi:hypothetical protein
MPEPKTKNYTIIDNLILKNKKFNKLSILEIKHSLRHYNVSFKSNLRKQDLFNLLNQYIMKITYNYDGVVGANEKITLIQTNIRKWLIKMKIKKQGMYIFNLSKCHNDKDPITLNELSDVNISDVVTYYDGNRHYWYEIESLYDMFMSGNYINPLNFKQFDEDFVDNLIKNRKPLQDKTFIDKRINKEIEKIKNRAFDLFHDYHILSGIPNLNSEYYLELCPYQLKQFYNGLIDLWDYRILEGIDNAKEYHENYVPNDVRIFARRNEIDKNLVKISSDDNILQYDDDSTCNNLIKVHNIILEDLENLLKYPKKDDKITTIFWVLTPLTEVNLKSAEKLSQFLVI